MANKKSYCKPIKPWRGDEDKKCNRDIRETNLKKANPTIQGGNLMECNFLCTCQKISLDHHANPHVGGRLDYTRCENVADGCQFQLEVFRTPDNRGWAARTAKGITIPKGALVSPYSGLIVDENRVKELEEIYSTQDKGSFLMNLYVKAAPRPGAVAVPTPGELFVNDATVYRNVSAFFNHTCEAPNVKFR